MTQNIRQIFCGAAFPFLYQYFKDILPDVPLTFLSETLLMKKDPVLNQTGPFGYSRIMLIQRSI